MSLGERWDPDAPPRLAFGTWGLTDGCAGTVSHALEAGYRHIDTAQSYGTEAEVGEALRRTKLSRGQVYLTTKLDRWSMRQPAMKRSMEESLRKLQTDYVDLLLIHWPSREVPLPETIEGMQELVDRGWVRQIGVSNFTSQQLHQACELAPIACTQVEYDPYLRQPALLCAAAQMATPLFAYSPIARGRAAVDPLLEGIGARYGRTASQVALRWILQQEGVGAVVRSSNVARITENMRVFDFALTQAEMEAISSLSCGYRLVNPVDAPRWDHVV